MKKILQQNWEIIPLHTYIVELLEKNKGTYTDDELFKALKEKNNDLSMRTFNKTLMNLEVSGLVRVTYLTKKKRNIELIANT